jgi:hypothetical protein
MRIDRRSDALCACCRRRATGIGFSPQPFKQPVLWTCGDPDCIQIARNTYDMPADQFSHAESRAAIMGGDSAGAFAEQIGKTDFATFTEEEWWEFCRRLVAGYRTALQNDLRNEAPF